MVWTCIVQGRINELVMKIDSWSLGDIKRGRRRPKMTWEYMGGEKDKGFRH